MIFHGLELIFSQILIIRKSNLKTCRSQLLLGLLVMVVWGGGGQSGNGGMGEEVVVVGNLSTGSQC